jgi:hypothetical protein
VSRPRSHPLPRAWLLLLPCLLACARDEAPGAQAGLVARLVEAAPADRGLRIEYPADGTILPPELPPIELRWVDGSLRVDRWQIVVVFADGEPLQVARRQRSWRPDEETWRRLKAGSRGAPARVTIVGQDRQAPDTIRSAATIHLRTSHDPVGAPLFYREVNLPFIEAVKDPSKIRWRFGAVGTPGGPPVVLSGLPVCGNCHSFSADGAVLGMDVDYASSKGSYALVDVARDIALTPAHIITWDDYRREDGQPTFGLLSQVSPDGRYVVSTVKDRSVFVPRPGLAHSQLFFPVKGILVVYDRQTGRFEALPGANDPRFVQSNPTWSPDGRFIVFTRAEAIELPPGRGVLLAPELAAEFLQKRTRLRYDLYRVPFNAGRGGRAEPIAGAADNGRSNFFPRYSPDGRHLVFCQADSFSLLQPDSELMLIPAEGGPPRRLRANLAGMNSWHSFSPNGRWLVFSSKARGPYTQLYLTHFDEQGRTSPPVWLERFTAPDRAANIPEFVNAAPDAIRRIHEAFVDDHSLIRAAVNVMNYGTLEEAAPLVAQALEMNPGNADAQRSMALVLVSRGDPEAALPHAREAVRLSPDAARAQALLGHLLLQIGDEEEALKALRRALTLNPNVHTEPAARRLLDTQPKQETPKM